MDDSVHALIVIAELVAGVTAISVIAAAAVGMVAMNNHAVATAEVLNRLVQAGSIIRLTTILAIVAALVTLSVLGKVPSDAAVAALSGIAGFVLGGAERSSHQRERSAENSN